MGTLKAISLTSLIGASTELLFNSFWANLDFLLPLIFGTLFDLCIPRFIANGTKPFRFYAWYTTLSGISGQRFCSAKDSAHGTSAISSSFCGNWQGWGIATSISLVPRLDGNRLVGALS